MAQYLLAVHVVEGTPMPSADEMQKLFAQVDRFNDEVRAAGAWVFAGGLQPPDTAFVIDARSGSAISTDAPFSASKEQLGGFWVIDVPDASAAKEWAAKASVACASPIEVRPFESMPD
jgi:hypothetical protein